MEIVLIDHARERMRERGATEEEVRQAVLSGSAVEAKRGREAKERVFSYNASWQGRQYSQKKVRAIFIDEGDRLTVLTVYVYFGEWNDQ